MRAFQGTQTLEALNPKPLRGTRGLWDRVPFKGAGFFLGFPLKEPRIGSLVGPFLATFPRNPKP